MNEKFLTTEEAIAKQNEFMQNLNNDEINWYVHYVFYDDTGRVNAHTHNLAQYNNGMELQLYASVDSKSAVRFLNTVGLSLKRDEIVLYDNDTIKVNGIPVKTKIFKDVDSNNRDIMRIILPDPNDKFPHDKECMEGFEYQLEEIINDKDDNNEN